MTLDRYTKAVLTVIAGCLLWLCAMGSARPVLAQQTTMDIARFSGRVQPVLIVGTGSMDAQGRVAVNFSSQPGPQRTDPTLPVDLPYTVAHPLPTEMSYSAAAPLPVEITGIKQSRDWEPIRTRVDDAPTRKTPGGGR